MEAKVSYKVATGYKSVTGLDEEDEDGGQVKKVVDGVREKVRGGGQQGGTNVVKQSVLKFKCGGLHDDVASHAACCKHSIMIDDTKRPQKALLWLACSPLRSPLSPQVKDGVKRNVMDGKSVGGGEKGEGR